MWKYNRQRTCLKIMNDWPILRLERCQKKSHVRLYKLSPNAQRRGKGGEIMFQSEQDFRIHCDLWTDSISESCYFRSNMNFVLAV